jgi:hypothetical protein
LFVVVAHETSYIEHSTASSIQITRNREQYSSGKVWIASETNSTLTPRALLSTDSKRSVRPAKTPLKNLQESGVVGG